MFLAQLPVLCLDCQTTDTTPGRGHLLEIAWGISSVEELEHSGFPDHRRQSSLVALPEGAELSPDVVRMTGITASLLGGAPPPEQALAALFSTAGRVAQCLIHYARFETAFIDAAREETERGSYPWEILCTYQISRRLLPELPAWGIRAVSGYFGMPLPRLQRAPLYAEATLRIWARLVRLLESTEGIRRLDELKAWLEKQKVPRARKRSYLVPRETLLKLPDSPGVYRMLGPDGSVLYVGKATSLKARVGSYFRQRTRRALRLSEMLAQVTDVSVTPTATALEAALLETDEIKARDPLYNTSLKAGNRSLRFCSPDFHEVSGKADFAHPLGPFPSMEPVETFATLLAALRGEVPVELLYPELPSEEAFEEGVRQALPETIEREAGCLLRFGHELLRRQELTGEEKRELDEVEGEEKTDREEDDAAWTAEDVAQSVQKLLARSARLLQRGLWITRLLDASLAWKTDECRRRLLIFEAGHLVRQEFLEPGAPLPVPPGWRRPRLERQLKLDLATYDRMRVLITEIRLLHGAGLDPRLCLSPRLELGERRLRRWLF